ncbi:hypothetical protein QE152_g6719 [Popillia japonica]|uniref:Uncharacterized protein n=1 Tax=Popillia japonica TaxID=7064 RepID=A0AAW1MG10_POPJA
MEDLYVDIPSGSNSTCESGLSDDDTDNPFEPGSHSDEDDIPLAEVQRNLRASRGPSQPPILPTRSVRIPPEWSKTDYIVEPFFPW